MTEDEKRRRKNYLIDSGGLDTAEDDVSIAPEVGKTEVSSPSENRAQGLAASQALSGGDVGSSLATYGVMSSGPYAPYAIGAGLGLKVIGAAAKRKERENELRAKMRLDRIQRQQSAINKLVEISKGMGL